MKKSIGLLSALVVSTTFIVNCQKAPDKRRVRPSNGPGTGAQTDVVDEKAKLPTKVCSKDILALYTVIYKNKATIDKTVITAASTDSEKESLRKFGVETLGKCDDIITSLKSETNEGCYRDNGVKDLSNALTSSNIQTFCNGIGKKLNTDVGLQTSYSDAAKAKEVAKQETSRLEKEYFGKEFKISEEGLNLMYEGNTNLGLYLLEGSVKSDQSSLEQALAASKTVCTGLGKGIAKDQLIESSTLKFNTFTMATKEDLSQIGIEHKGEAIVLNFVLYDKKETTTLGALLCLNLQLDTLTIKQLDTVLGKVITSAPTQVTTEVTGGTSEAAVVSTPAASTASSTASATTKTTDKLAAAQPEGSPQQKLLDVAMAPTVKKEAEQKAAAKEQAKEEQKPAVTLVPATGVSSPAVAAKVEAESKATKEELASMKEKAERLEKEAKDAEAEVTKLETEKAKADDIDQAKAKARIARESANSAKAEYDAAAKQA